jgi:hypothetical protein
MNIPTSLDNEAVDRLFPLLSSLENLGALSENFGLLEIKPFRDWSDHIWKNKIFSLRLCNAGEMLSIYSQLANFPEIARVQATKIEIIIRSIYTIADQPLISPEALAQYNDSHKSQLTTLEFLRQWVGNLEQIVIDRLDMIYGGLQLKQERQLQGVSLCANCENQFTELPEGSKKLKYSLAEIVCGNCIKEIKDFSDFDFGETVPSTAPEESSPVPEVVSFTCPDCQKELPDRESFNTHRSTCTGTSTV